VLGTGVEDLNINTVSH